MSHQGILFPLTQKYGKITSNKTRLIDHYQLPNKHFPQHMYMQVQNYVQNPLSYTSPCSNVNMLQLYARCYMRSASIL
nr:hypothetical protein CFP56_53551 [Quercus suber]